jgi:hypothetical protein
VIATVGDTNIRAEDLQRELQPTLERLRAQLGGAIDQQQIKRMGVVDSVLEQLVNRIFLKHLYQIPLIKTDVPNCAVRST